MPPARKWGSRKISKHTQDPKEEGLWRKELSIYSMMDVQNNPNKQWPVITIQTPIL